MDRDPEPSRPDEPVGERALAAGLAAFVCAFVPVIGEFIAVPAAIVAVVLGAVGVRRFEAGRAARVGAAAAGAILGAVTGLMIVVVLAATHFGP